MRRTRCGNIAMVSLLSLATMLGCQDDLSRCEITQSDCQEEIYTHTLSLRGDGYDPYGGMPPTSVITEDQYRQLLLTQPQSAGPWDRALTLLHFTSTTAGSYIDDEVANVQAYYSWSTKSVTIVSHPTQTGTDAENNSMITL